MRKTAALALLSAAMVLWPRPGLAQDAPITAEVDRSQVAVDEVLTLTVTIISEDDVPPPALPSFEGVDIKFLSKSTAMQLRVVGGQTSAQRVIHYRLRPTSAGNLRIGPITINMEGKEYSTSPILVQVTSEPVPPSPTPTPTPVGQSSTGSSGPKRTFVEARVDETNPYLGQQVVYIVEYYRSEEYLRRPPHDFPDFTGFWRHEGTYRRWYVKSYADRSYRIMELSTLLFPTVSGPVVIDPATISTYRVDAFRGRAPVTDHLVTETVSLVVRPLPAGAPAEFDGAVGSLGISAETDVTEGAVNEPVRLTVVVSGEGNLETLPDPVLPDMPRWRAFDRKTEVEVRVTDGRLMGRRVYERIYVPDEPGEVTIPPISYSYFDPIAEEYNTVSTDPIDVFIAPGRAETPVVPLLDAPRAQVERLGVDIRYIKPAPPVLEPEGVPFTRRDSYWLAWAVPLLALMAGAGWRLRARLRQGGGTLDRSANAERVARRILDAARIERVDPHVVVRRVLTSYVSDKLGRPVAGLTHSGLAALLAERDIEPGLIQRVGSCLASADGAEFAPGQLAQGRGEQVLEETERLIVDLERGLGP